MESRKAVLIISDLKKFDQKLLVKHSEPSDICRCGNLKTKNSSVWIPKLSRSQRKCLGLLF